MNAASASALSAPKHDRAIAEASSESFSRLASSTRLERTYIHILALPVMAPSKKRTRAASGDSASDVSDDDFSIASAAASDDEVDISSALTGRTNKKRKLGAGPLAPVDSDIDGDGDDAIEELIRESIA